MSAAQERWTVIGDDPRNLHVVIAGAEHLRVCFLTSDGPTEKRAALIAAAPNLLTELKALRRRFHAACVHAGNSADVANDACASADAAIAAAESQS